MPMFLSGLGLFFILHFATVTPAVRSRLAAHTGETAWKGIMALGSLAAVALIAIGWTSSPNAMLFPPSALAVRLAPVLVGIALVLFVIGGGNLKGYIKRTLHHPMLVGAMLWSATHLLANGGWRETLLFGAFLAFSVYAFCALMIAGKRASFIPSWKKDAVGLTIGLFLAAAVMHGHQWLFGVAVPIG